MKHRKADDGMTLIELLIAISILLVIMTPLVASFVLSLATTSRVDQDITNSADAQLLASYYDADVSNADTVGTTSSCGATGTVLEVAWRDGATRHYVAYLAAPDAEAQAKLGAASPVYTLTRAEWITSAACTPSQGPPARSQLLVRTASVLPVPSCDGAACPATGGRPRTVSLPIDDLARSTGEHFAFTLTATRKVTT